MGKSFMMKKIKQRVLAIKSSKQKNNKRKFLDRIKTDRDDLENDVLDFHFIEFNAWVYSGSDHLWAGLITHLYKEVEKHLSWRTWYFRLGVHFRKNLINFIVILLLYFLVGVLLMRIIDYRQIIVTWNVLVLILSATVGTIIGGSAILSIPKFFETSRNLFNAFFTSKAEKLNRLISKTDFSKQIGIMSEIKEEINFLSNLLQRGKKGKPTRVIIFIDDLDRCPHEKACEVLEAIMLLLSDDDVAPYVIFLGIDARVIVKAIEQRYGDMLVKAGISGFEYLDKIVQIPFSIPFAADDSLTKYIDSLLWGSSDEKNAILSLENSIPQKIAPRSENVRTVDTLSLFRSYIDGIQEGSSIDTEREIDEEALHETESNSVQVTFSRIERNAFTMLVDNYLPNPRKIKRIINQYRFVRLLIPNAPDNVRMKVIQWIALTEQWPLRATWILEYVKDGLCLLNSADHSEETTIKEIYNKIRDNVFTETRDLLVLDGDEFLFTNFLNKEPVLTVGDIKQMMTITVNINPAIQEEVHRLSKRYLSFSNTL